ncbi:autophagy protein 6 [Actinomortierella ambigua]|uniref:Autophagy protein 6 n=1 Tax=Actinomortierella ambigua TaxID=1343610 RepID=A0A9P6PXT5_9FUNG|nr:autophagy protein 6 [Actinomortierella ambigua]
MTDSRSFYCQRCNQQLRIDDSLQSINSAAFDLLLGPLSDSNGQSKGGSKAYDGGASGSDEARKAPSGQDSGNESGGLHAELAAHRHHQHRDAMFTRTIPPGATSARRGGPGSAGSGGAGLDGAASTINFGTSESFVVLPKGSSTDGPTGGHRGLGSNLGYSRSHGPHLSSRTSPHEGTNSPASNNGQSNNGNNNNNTSYNNSSNNNNNNLSRSASTPSPVPRGGLGAGSDVTGLSPSSAQPYGAYQPAALAMAQNEANKDRMARASRLKTTAKLFDLMSAKSDIDHPLCQECCDMLMDGLTKQLRDVSRERDCYIDFLRTVNTNVISQEEMEELEREIEQIQLDEKASIQTLRDIEEQQEAVKAEIAKLEEEAAELDKEEERYWQECNEFQIALQAFHDERDSLNLKYDYDTRQLEKLHKANVYNDTFCISQDGSFATINGFRLGRLPDQPVDWPEINAAWGQTLLLLHTAANKLNFTFKTYKLVPLGSFSRIDKIEGDKASYELYGSGDYALGRMFMNRRFDQAMVAYLNCLQQLCDYAQQEGPKLAFPYKINKDKIGDASIKLQFNQDETWTRALRFTLVNTKWILAYVSSATAPKMSSYTPSSSAPSLPISRRPSPALRGERSSGSGSGGVAL